MENEEGKKENNVDQIFFLTKIAIVYDVPDFPYVILFTADAKPVRFVISIL